MFYEENTFERQYAIEKVREPSTVELYYFLQAFLQAAPQVILQLYILLREDTFRNYETCKYFTTRFPPIQKLYKYKIKIKF